MDTFENTDILCIDPDAKLRVSLTKIKKVEPFYIGKLQFPSPLDFEDGISFMAFLAEDECEELQIAPLDPSRRVRRDGFGMCNGRVSISLRPMQDRWGNTYYVGEACGSAKLDLRRGIFFTLFVSRPGQEELQIQALDHSRRRKQNG